MGADADFAVFDPDAQWTVSPEHLHFRHKISPYLGMELLGTLRATWLRGEVVWHEGQFAGEPRGQELVRR